MKYETSSPPVYRGLQWLHGHLPDTAQVWPRENNLEPDSDQDDISRDVVSGYCQQKTWTWSGKTVYFFCDIHADADAFFLSLVASGGVEKTGPADEDFELTPAGRDATFIIGGDCFDKGPDNLRLLEVIHQLFLKNADIVLLAGNHDIRTFLGIYYAESKAPLLDHLFVRMGKKTVPLFKEIYERFVAGSDEPHGLLHDDVRERLFPSDNWYDTFRDAAKPWVRREKLDKELKRIKEKTIEFDAQAAAVGLDLGKIYAATRKFKEIFFNPEGRYYWFFDKMQLVHREGSYLFAHAGVDDTTAQQILTYGVDGLNNEFRRMLAEDPFALYHGELGNVFRTKYRSFDFEFTEQGVDALHRSGLYAIVHGHRNILQGQRVTIRCGMLNFECDASVDANTRVVEGLNGHGGAVVIFTPTGQVQGISTDYPYAKTFYPGSITISDSPSGQAPQPSQHA